MYHTATQKAYDELMVELESKGYKWVSGHKPTSLGNWESMKEYTCIEISGKYITYGPLEQLKKQHQNTPVIEYKEKEKNMKIYYTETREDYDSLMSELKEKVVNGEVAQSQHNRIILEFMARILTFMKNVGNFIF